MPIERLTTHHDMMVGFREPSPFDDAYHAIAHHVYIRYSLCTERIPLRYTLLPPVNMFTINYCKVLP